MSKTETHWAPNGGADWYEANRRTCAHKGCTAGPLFYTSKPGQFDVLMCQGHAQASGRVEL